MLIRGPLCPQLLHPHTPTSLATSRLLGLIRYRTDQATFRGSTAEQAASLLLAEVVGAMIWSLHTATRHDFLLESLVYAKVRGRVFPDPVSDS